MKHYIKTVAAKAVSIISVTTILLSSGDISAFAAGSHDGILVDRAEHSDLNFKDYEYRRMDEAEFKAIVDGLDTLCADEANSDQTIEVVVKMEDYCNELHKNYSIANLYSNLYADDDKYDDEVKYYNELSDNVFDQVMQNYKLVAESPCADALKKHVDDDDDWNEILEYEPMTDEQKELSKKQTDLSLKYDDLSLKKYTTNIKGKDYDADSIEDAIASGTIGYDEYLNGLADVIKQSNQEKAELFIELVEVRNELAKSYGYSNYTEYAYDKVYDRDYDPDQLGRYRKSVIDNMVPLASELRNILRNDYKDDTDAMFKEKISEDECLQKLKDHLPEISNDMLVSYQYMIDHDLYDISVSDHKAPGGFTTGINGYNAPFLYNCADGTLSDMQTLIHEFGHYNEMYYQTADTWYYDASDLDLAEIHSQGLELLFMDYGDDIYGKYADAMKVYSQFNLAYAAIEGVKEDEFQQLVYADTDGLTVDELNELYYQCCEKYGVLDSYNSYYLGDYGYLNTDQLYEWVDIPHTFQSPLYYVSYSVSVAAVYELFHDIITDRDAAIDTYLNLVKEEFQDGFQDTLRAAGVNNPITVPRFDLYADDVRSSLGLQEKGHAEYSEDDLDNSLDKKSRFDNSDGTPQDDEDEDTDQSITDTEDDDDIDEFGNTPDDNDTDNDDADDEDEELRAGVVVFCVLIGCGAVLIILILVVIIIVIANGDKKKLKEWEAAQKEVDKKQDGSV